MPLVYGERPFHDVEDTLDIDRWLIAGIWPKGLTLLEADRKVGKTWLASDVVLAVTEGMKLAGVFPSLVYGKGVYYSREDPPPGLKGRIRKVALARGLTKFEHLHIATMCHSLRLDSKEGQAGIVKAIEKLRPQILCFDTVRKFYSGDENSSTDVAKVTTFLTKLVHIYDMSIILNHHLTKSTGRGRGSGEWEAAADAIIKLTPVEEPGHISFLVTGEARQTAPPVTWRYSICKKTFRTFAYMSPEGIDEYRELRTSLGLEVDGVPDTDVELVDDLDNG